MRTTQTTLQLGLSNAFSLSSWQVEITNLSLQVSHTITVAHGFDRLNEDYIMSWSVRLQRKNAHKI